MFALRLRLLAIGFCSMLCLAQSTPSPDQILVSAVALARAGKFDANALGAFCDDFKNAVVKDPDAVRGALPDLALALRDSNQDVLGIGLTATFTIGQSVPNGPQIMNSLKTDLARIANNAPTQYRVFLLIMIGDPITRASDEMVSIVKSVLDSRPKETRVLLASAEALIGCRPVEEDSQAKIVALMSDATVDRSARLSLFHAIGLSVVLSGSPLFNYIVLRANTSDDVDWRNAAISAVERSTAEARVLQHTGLNGLDEISDRLAQIVKDPRESSKSIEIAQHALDTRASFQPARQ